MKKFVCIFICLIAFQPWVRTYSQTERMKPKKFEMTGTIKLNGKDGPRKIILEENGAIIFAGKWGASLSHNFYTVKARSLPADFRCSLLNAEPPDLLETYSIRALRNFSTASDKLRFGVECGIAWLYYKSAVFTLIDDKPSRSYYISYRATNSVGLSVRFKSEIILNRIAGIELATVANINSSHVYLGCELCVTGKLVKEKTRSLKRKKR
jgi:hypothetical protein